MFLIRALAAITACLSGSQAFAFPDFLNTAATSGDFSVYAIYRDSVDPNRFWVPYDRLSIAKDEGGRFLFGIVHWGITAPDIDGTGATLTVTAGPSAGGAAFEGAIAAIRATNPSAIFSPMPIVDSEYELILDNRFVFGSTAQAQANLSSTPPPSISIVPAGESMEGVVAQDGETAVLSAALDGREVVSGGAGGASQAFVIQLERLGGRVLAAEGVKGGTDFVLRYRYKVKGVGPRLHARITVYWKKLLQQFQLDGSGSAYFGAVNANMRVAYQKLKESGAVKVEVLDGGVGEGDALEAYVKELYEVLTKAYINGTGLFQAELKPVAAPGLPSGSVGQVAGWSVNSSIFAQVVSEEQESIFEIDKQELTEQWFHIGVSLGQSCTQNSVLFINITEPSKPCISPQSIDDFFRRVNSCLIRAQAYGDELAASGVDAGIVRATLNAYSDACRR